MKRIFDERSRDSSALLRNGNRKYTKRGVSPDTTSHMSTGHRSNQ